MADVKCLLSEAADISRHEPAILTADQSLLYHEFEERVLFATTHLHEAGCRPGARIALWMDNSWQHLVLLMAVLRLRAIAVPVSTRWPARLVVEQLRRIGCETAITEASRAAEIAVPGLRILHPDALCASAEAIPERHVQFALDQAAVVVFTSGSSGAPRAAQLSYGNLYYSALGSNRNIKLLSHDRWVLSLPLYHVGGLGILFRCLLAGATVVIPGADETIESAQEKFRATHLSLVGTQLYRLLRAEKLPASFRMVKAILLGGSAISPALVAAAHHRKLPVFPSYGLTEMASQVTTMRPDSPPPKHETSGKLLKNRDLQIADDGEILVCGDTLFQGYVEDGRVRDARDAHGWFHTGDLGSLDADGYLTVHGRKDFMFISGGENIHPEEIEVALMRLGGIEQALVVPVADPEFGQRPVAFLRVSGAMPSQTTLSSRLGEWLPGFKLPVAYHPWPAEDLGPLAKPDRRRAAVMAAALPR